MREKSLEKKARYTMIYLIMFFFSIVFRLDGLSFKNNFTLKPMTAVTTNSKDSVIVGPFQVKGTFLNADRSKYLVMLIVYYRRFNKFFSSILTNTQVARKLRFQAKLRCFYLKLGCFSRKNSGFRNFKSHFTT